MNKLGFYTEQNGHITHANGAYLETIANDAITDPEIRNLAIGLITTEQDEAIGAMQAQYELDIEEAERIPEVDTRRIGEIAKIIAEYEAADENKKRQLGILATFYAQARDIELADHESVIDALTQEKERLSAKREVPYDGNEYLYAAWNIPVREVSHVEPFKFPQYFDWQNESEAERQASFEDVFPDELRPCASESIGRAVRERHGYLTDAGWTLVYLAASQMGRPWTREELGPEVYFGDNARTPEQKVRNVGSLLSNYHNNAGSTIPEGLKAAAGEGEVLELQIGRRYPLKNGKRWGKGARICRVVVVGQPIPRFDNEGFEDMWSEDKPVRAEIGASVVAEAIDGNEQQINPAVSDIDNEHVPSAAELAQQLVVGKQRPEKEAWAVAFKQAAIDELSRLIEAGLPVAADEMKSHEIAHLGSRALGTKVGYQRAQRAGILSEAPRAHDSIPVDAIVAMSLLNSNQAVFSNPKRRKEAFGIITQVVSDELSRLRSPDGR